jgi:hypothetical protein
MFSEPHGGRCAFVLGAMSTAVNLLTMLISNRLVVLWRDHSSSLSRLFLRPGSSGVDVKSGVKDRGIEVIGGARFSHGIKWGGVGWEGDVDEFFFFVGQSNRAFGPPQRSVRNHINEYKRCETKRWVISLKRNEQSLMFH